VTDEAFVRLVGTVLTAPVTKKFQPSGKVRAAFSVVTRHHDEGYNQTVDRHLVYAWDEYATLAAELEAGDRVCLEGRLHSRVRGRGRGERAATEVLLRAVKRLAGARESTAQA